MRVMHILVPFLVCGICNALNEPQCTSQFDYEHKLLYKLLKIEMDVKMFREYIEELKSEHAKRELEQRKAFEAALAAFEAEGKKAVDALNTQAADTRAMNERLTTEQNKTFESTMAHIGEQTKEAVDAFKMQTEDAHADYKRITTEQNKTFAATITQIKADTKSSVTGLRSEAADEQMEHNKTFVATMAQIDKETKKTLDDVQLKSSGLLSDVEEVMRNLSAITKKFQAVKPIGFTLSGPKSTKSGQMTFRTGISNDGEVFDVDAGQFVCKTQGVYFFTVSLLKTYSYNSNVYCRIYKNGNYQVVADTYPGHSGRQGRYAATNSVYLHLVVGDKVTVEGCTSLSSFAPESSFTGFLVKADII